MSAEHPPVPAEHAHRPAAAKAETVKDLAEAIAEQIATQQATANPISGNFKAIVTFQGVKYTVDVEAPVPDEDDPGFWIAKGNRQVGEETPLDFLDFAFKDKDNWKVGLGLPVPVKITDTFTINHLFGEFQMGDVPGDDTPLEIEA